MSYRMIIADPPWPETGGGGRGSGNHYATVKYDEMAHVLLSAPEFRPERAYWLGLWTTASSYAQAVDLMRACGCTPVTFWTWVKIWKEVQDSLPGTDPVAHIQASLHLGMGQYGRQGSVELLLLGKRGTIGRRDGDDWQSASATLVAPVGAHSEKPDVFYEQLVRVFDGPYLEMFARKRRPGWDAHGMEVEGCQA